MSDPVQERLAEIRQVTQDALVGMVINGGPDFTWALLQARKTAADMLGIDMDQVEAEVVGTSIVLRWPPPIHVDLTITKVDP